MILRDSLNNVRETTDEISVPLISQEVECVKNEVIGSIEYEDFKIWIPRLMRS